MTPLEWTVFSVVCGALILLGYVDKNRQAHKSDPRDLKPKPDRNRPKAEPSRGSTRDDPPNYDRPIYDRDGNKIGVIYDAPPMPGPSGLS